MKRSRVALVAALATVTAIASASIGAGCPALVKARAGMFCNGS
jgi:hypothetical protein